MSEPLRGIVVSHSAVAQSLVAAVAAIAGVEDALLPVSKEGCDERVLADRLTAAIVGDANGLIRRINIGGVHHRDGRSERLRYVYLTDAEANKLRQLAARGIEISAQDVPTARAVPLEEFV